jgi:hypothetical protein
MEQNHAEARLANTATDALGQCSLKESAVEVESFAMGLL